MKFLFEPRFSAAFVIAMAAGLFFVNQADLSTSDGAVLMATLGFLSGIASEKRSKK